MLIHDPVRWTPVESTGVHQTYIGSVYCTFLESGQWSICDYIKVQSGGLQRTPPDTHLPGYICCMFLESGQSSPADSTGHHRTPTYLDYSQNLISRGFSPADSLDPHFWTTLNFIFQWTPVVPTCDNM